MTLLRPLLAAKTTDEDLKRLRYPKLISPKIDGIRALVVNGVLVSRTLKPIRNKYTQELFGREELEGLDGELVVGPPYAPDLMQRTSSGVMTFTGQPNVFFYVFDKWDLNEPFRERFGLAKAMVAYNQYPRLRAVDHEEVSTYDQVLELEADYLGIGYEGAMLRCPNGLYKQNRSTLREEILLKVKRFVDGEAIILEVHPLLRNLNAGVLDERGLTKRSSHRENKVPDDLLGTVLVRDCKSGVVFSVGSGFTEGMRQSLWDGRASLIGKILKYKSFAATGVKDAPRHPIFVGFRHEDDM